MPRQKAPQNRLTLARIFPVAFGGAFVLMGAIFLYALGIQTEINCRRADTLNCTLRATWMGLVETGQTPVNDLQKSWVDSRCDQDGCMYWVMLTTTNGGEVHFDDTRSSDRDPEGAISDQINADIQNLEKRSFSVARQDGLWIILPLVFIAVGLLIAIGLPLIFSPKNMTVKE